MSVIDFVRKMVNWCDVFFFHFQFQLDKTLNSEQLTRYVIITMTHHDNVNFKEER